MSKILIDVTRLLTRLYDGLLPTGVDRVGLAYVHRYGGQARAVLSERGVSSVLTERDSLKTFEWLTSSICNRNSIRRLVISACIGSLRKTAFERGILLHTSHNGMEFQRYYRAMERRNVRSVFMVHDLIPLTHAEYCRPAVDQAHRQRIRAALEHADGLIVNSRFTLDSLIAEAQQAHLRMPPAVVAHLASGLPLRAHGKRPIDTPYFVFLSTIEPRKNHWLILHVWRRIVEEYGNAAPKLVIIGRRGWECENVVDMLERCVALKGVVIEEASCSDERLSTYLRYAQALLFPSFVEGYGMPLVEALELQVPILASDIDVFHEIAGDIPEYIDPLDGLGWIEQIKEYMQPASRARAAQLDRVKHFRAPTWTTHFDRVDDFIDSLQK